jgi:hypothetical protein
MINAPSTQLIQSVKASMNSSDFNEIQSVHNLKNESQPSDKDKKNLAINYRNSDNDDRLGSMEIDAIQLYNVDEDPTQMT